MRQLGIWGLLFSVLLFSHGGYSQSPKENGQEAVSKDSFSAEDDWIFSNQMKRPNKRRSSIVGFPLLSLAVPGLGQFMNGQTGAGFVYSGMGFAGAATAISGLVELNDRVDEENDEDEIEGFDSKDPAARRFIAGASFYQLAGSLSLYHSFQTVLNFRQEEGDFNFLPKERENHR